jgi:putative tricarboxylic transport membrane protein
VGYAMQRLRFPPAPLVLGLVLGDKAESSLRTALLIGGGDPFHLVSGPLALSLFALVVFVLAFPLLRARFGLARRPVEENTP